MIERITASPGQESVWDYPRPPRLEPVTRRLRVMVGDIAIADTMRGFRVLETSHPPVYYIPMEDVRADCVRLAAGSSVCEWKGRASYWDVVVGNDVRAAAAWSYGDPSAAFALIRDALAFYANRVDACYVDDERVTPQPGRFYGGWITDDVVGPFKGEPGTQGW
ncbi:MAG: DUF427 domain-containing protein [Clostridia bacterium]|nr:DUF427 domain-containing protein [Deltaproteobacteria bacterium]